MNGTSGIEYPSPAARGRKGTSSRTPKAPIFYRRGKVLQGATVSFANANQYRNVTQPLLSSRGCRVITRQTGGTSQLSPDKICPMNNPQAPARVWGKDCPAIAYSDYRILYTDFMLNLNHFLQSEKIRQNFIDTARQYQNESSTLNVFSLLLVKQDPRKCWLIYHNNA